MPEENRIATLAHRLPELTIIPTENIEEMGNANALAMYVYMELMRQQDLPLDMDALQSMLGMDDVQYGDGLAHLRKIGLAPYYE